MADFTKIIGINLDDVVKIDGISADSIEKVNGLTPDDGGGGGGSGIEQHGDFVVLQGAQNQSYLNQVVANPAANNTYIYEDEGGGIFRIRADRFPDGSDDQLYGLLTATLPSLTDLANNTDLVIRFEIEAKGAHYGLMAQDDLENFTKNDVEKNSIICVDQRTGSNAGRVLTINRTNMGSTTSNLNINVIRFSKDGSGNFTVKWQTYNAGGNFYVDRVTATNNSTFNANFDPTQPLRFFVYSHTRQDAVLVRNIETLTE
tara:strand:- start:983 stop:1759 length:777 start_codon:yes stop_codon:yes gene_type:complete